MHKIAVIAMEKILLSSSDRKMKDSWEREDNYKDYPYGYPWPPRYYTCSFCQREFKSAQALGGHMNIHRKDRARLRDLSPDQNPNPNPNRDSKPHPNPNPNPVVSLSSPSSCSTQNNIYAQQYSMVSLSLSSIPPSTKEDRVSLHSQGVGKCKKISYSSVDDLDYHDQKVRILESSTSAKEVVRLDLELCLGDAKEEDDDLDLELRLGI